MNFKNKLTEPEIMVGGQQVSDQNAVFSLKC